MPQYLSRVVMCSACRSNKAELTLNDTKNNGKTLICIDCAKELYPELWKELNARD